jgi:CRISPR-associated protein Csx3
MSQQSSQPAVLIGGPPHAGKSVLTYSLTRALRQYGIEHYVMRACPDGEGHWSQEAPRQVAEAMRQKGTYSDEFVRRVCADIAQRQVPFIVDIGGLPQGEQFQIFECCTAAILLRHSAPAERDWPGIIAQHRLNLLADLISELDGTPTLEEYEAVLRGTLVGLHRGSTIQGEPFDSLVRRLVELFREPGSDLDEIYAAKAPTEPVLNLPQILQTFAPLTIDWTPDMLPSLLAAVPARAPLAAYGRAPHWIYSALALHTYPAAFYQFDARLGWLEPLRLKPGSGNHPEIAFTIERREDSTILHSSLLVPNLAYSQLAKLHVPEVPDSRGVVISGKLPLWLSSSLALSYQQSGVPWIAGYYPQLEGAIVLASCVSTHQPGDLIPITPGAHNY